MSYTDNEIREKFEKVKEYIRTHYNCFYAEGKPCVDDCAKENFWTGYDVGNHLTYYNIGIMLGIELEKPNCYHEEDDEDDDDEDDDV